MSYKKLISQRKREVENLISNMKRRKYNDEEEPHLDQPTLNPMVFYKAFQHITKQIFEKLGTKSLKNCRKVAKSWQVYATAIFMTVHGACLDRSMVVKLPRTRV